MLLLLLLINKIFILISAVTVSGHQFQWGPDFYVCVCFWIIIHSMVFLSSGSITSLIIFNNQLLRVTSLGTRDMTVRYSLIFQKLILLEQGLTNFLIKGQIVNILGFVGHMVSCNYSALSLQHGQHISEWAWLHSSLTLCMELKFGFHMIIICHEIFLFQFSSTI